MPEFYEKYWDHTSESLGDFSLKWPKLSGFIPRQPGVSILDLGCGKGEIIGAIAKINVGASYIGLDVSRTAIDYARQKYPNVKFEKIEDGEKFPLMDSSVDFIFSSEVIEHIYNTENAFREMSRVLRPGGEVLLTTPHHGLIKNLILVLFGFDKHFNPTSPHVRFFSKKSLFSLLRQSGFEILKHGYYGRFYPVSHSIFVLAKKK